MRHDLRCIGGLDWGFNNPGVMLWVLILPDSHLHVWREYKFQQTPAHDVATQIVQRTKALGVKLDYIAADPAMWQHTGAGRGEAIAETLIRHKLPLKKSDNDRINGWLRVHELLRRAPDGLPWLTIEADPHCAYLRRTIASAMSDKSNPDDLDTTGEDHALDALRYLCMSRPPLGKSIIAAARNQEWSFGWLKSRSSSVPTGTLTREVRVA